MKLFLELVIVVCYATGLVRSNQNFRYEKMHNFGLGRRVIQNYRQVNPLAYEYPAALPSTKPSPIALMRQPFQRLYQGVRRKGMDRRVYNEKFDYPASSVGCKVKFESLFDCTVTFLSIETQEGIPIILRGGAGYRHFTVIVRALPGTPLHGSVKAYCKKDAD